MKLIRENIEKLDESMPGSTTFIILLDFELIAHLTQPRQTATIHWSINPIISHPGDKNG
jgi:hypothetical protein